MKKIIISEASLLVRYKVCLTIRPGRQTHQKQKRKYAFCTHTIRCMIFQYGTGSNPVYINRFRSHTGKCVSNQ